MIEVTWQKLIKERKMFIVKKLGGLLIWGIFFYVLYQLFFGGGL